MAKQRRKATNPFNKNIHHTSAPEARKSKPARRSEEGLLARKESGPPASENEDKHLLQLHQVEAIQRGKETTMRRRRRELALELVSFG